MMIAFHQLMHFHDSLGHEDQPTNQHDEVTDRGFKMHHGEIQDKQRLGQTRQPTDGEQQDHTHDHCGNESQPSCCGSAGLRQTVTKH